MNLLLIKKNKVVYEILPELDVLQNQNKKNTKFESITNNIFGDEVETINWKDWFKWICKI